MKEKIISVCREFGVGGQIVDYFEIKSGHINNTYKVTALEAEGEHCHEEHCHVEFKGNTESGHHHHHHHH